MNFESGCCYEIVVYRIAPESAHEFQQIRAQIYNVIQKMPGFVSAVTFESVRGESVLVDLLEWNSETEAMEAYSKFKEIPGAAEFMKYVEEVTFSAHLRVLHQKLSN